MSGVARAWQDPQTRDYVIENGAARSDTTRVSDVLRRLRTRRGTIPGRPRFGSLLHTIRKLDRGVEARAESFARAALADLVQRREIRELVVTATRVQQPRGTPQATTLQLVVSFTDREGAPQNVRYSAAIT